MVKQGTPSKTSSTHFEIRGRFVVAVWDLFTPQNTRIDNDHIVGNYGLPEISERDWKEMPHVFLANILRYNEQGKWTTKHEPGLRIDPQSVERFVRTYGGFREAYVEDDEGHRIFDQDIAEVAKRQERLRRAWRFQAPFDGPHHMGDKMIPDDLDLFNVQDALGWSIGDEHKHFVVNMFPGSRYDEIDLTTDDLWELIAYLFLRDFVACKIGLCGNPDCPAPYYLKTRKSQKYCERGPCTEYAHRQYALKWWRETGQRRRAKKQGRRIKKRGKSPGGEKE